MNNVMLDLETWGTQPGSAIRSIGAVMFEPTSTEIGADKFYQNILDESCVGVGLTRDAGTEAWWAKPEQRRAQESLSVDPRPIAEVIDGFNTWWQKNRGIFVWSQGSNFDSVLWEAVAKACGKRVPWRFYDTRDTRTAYDMAGFNSRAVRRVGTYHNALADAEHQALCVQRSYAKVQGRMA